MSWAPELPKMSGTIASVLADAVQEASLLASLYPLLLDEAPRVSEPSLCLVTLLLHLRLDAPQLVQALLEIAMVDVMRARPIWTLAGATRRV